MKNLLRMKNVLFVAKTILLCSIIFAYSPKGLTYESFAVNGEGNAIGKKRMILQVSILDGAPDGTLLYRETQEVDTNDSGKFTIEIGNGDVVQGSFNVINWMGRRKWLKTEIDTNGNGNFFTLGNEPFIRKTNPVYLTAVQ